MPESFWRITETKSQEKRGMFGRPYDMRIDTDMEFKMAKINVYGNGRVVDGVGKMERQKEKNQDRFKRHVHSKKITYF